MLPPSFCIKFLKKERAISSLAASPSCIKCLVNSIIFSFPNPPRSHYWNNDLAKSLNAEDCFYLVLYSGFCSGFALSPFFWTHLAISMFLRFRCAAAYDIFMPSYRSSTFSTRCCLFSNAFSCSTN